MKHILGALLAFFWHLGGVGLLILGIFDSSFLFAPMGNDLLVVAFTARQHSIPAMFYYAAMSTAGSVLGVLLVDVVFRPAGEHGLEKHLSRQRIDYIKSKVDKNAVWGLIVACLAPPPFPFTPFVMGAAALQYPRRRLLLVIAAARMIRFTGLGVLALFFGRHILQWAKNGVVQDFFLGLIAVFVIGSVASVVGWIKRSRKANGRSPETQPEREPAERVHR
jgi:membrane protein YqaA with SNARE-associated domain